jgi:fluoroacetyl-CoA thioesterase
MGLDRLQPGLRHEASIRVTEALTVPAMAHAYPSLADMPPVFATAFMIALVEWTCVEALRPYLLPHQHSVGIHVDISHKAATPIGMQVTAKVELIEIRERRLRFQAICRDEVEEIGAGFHERAIIDQEKFLNRVLGKGAPLQA